MTSGCICRAENSASDFCFRNLRHSPVCDKGGLLFAKNSSRRALEPKTLRRIFVVLTAALPLALYFALGEPVTLLKIAGAIEAIHIPIVTAFTLCLNRARLSQTLRPSAVSIGATVIAGGFFLAFALLYLSGLV